MYVYICLWGKSSHPTQLMLFYHLTHICIFLCVRVSLPWSLQSNTARVAQFHIKFVFLHLFVLWSTHTLWVPRRVPAIHATEKKYTISGGRSSKIKLMATTYLRLNLPEDWRFALDVHWSHLARAQTIEMQRTPGRPTLICCRSTHHSSDTLNVLAIKWSNEWIRGTWCKIAEDCVQVRGNELHPVIFSCTLLCWAAEQKQMQSVWKCMQLSHNTVCGESAVYHLCSISSYPVPVIWEEVRESSGSAQSRLAINSSN